MVLSEKVENYFLWNKPWLTKVDLRKKCNAKYRIWKKDWDKWSLFLDPLWFLLLPLAVSHSLAAIESHPREGGKVTVVELSTRLSLNHGDYFTSQINHAQKEHENGKDKNS